jgi:hypothetical protein
MNNSWSNPTLTKDKKALCVSCVSLRQYLHVYMVQYMYIICICIYDICIYKRCVCVCVCIRKQESTFLIRILAKFSSTKQKASTR